MGDNTPVCDSTCSGVKLFIVFSGKTEEGFDPSRSGSKMMKIVGAMREFEVRVFWR